MHITTIFFRDMQFLISIFSSLNFSVQFYIQFFVPSHKILYDCSMTEILANTLELKKKHDVD